MTHKNSSAGSELKIHIINQWDTFITARTVNFAKILIESFKKLDKWQIQYLLRNGKN
jgi:hypothetical protein